MRPAGSARPASRAPLALRGEALAAEFLRSRGHVVLGERVRVARGEVDLITRSGRHIYFVEVKTRSRASDAVGGAGASISSRRAARMRHVADTLNARFVAEGEQPHLAVLWVERHEGRSRISFWPDAIDG